MTPCEHFVQIYEDDTRFVETLAAFIGDGLEKGEACIVIATPVHRRKLRKHLRARGIDPRAAAHTAQLILLDAQETMEKFLVEGWPDERLFTALVTDLLEKASHGGRKVRAFGEMVALMWARGHKGATIRLEHLWTQLCRRESLALFCAYPKIGFTEHAAESITRVCVAHSRVLTT